MRLLNILKSERAIMQCCFAVGLNGLHALVGEGSSLDRYIILIN